MYCSLCSCLYGPGGAVAPHSRFDHGHQGVSESCNWYVGRQEACEMMGLKENKCYALKKQLMTGLGGRCLGTGQSPVVSPPRLVAAGRSGRRRQLFLIYIYIYIYVCVFFWKSMEITDKMLEWWKVFQDQLLPGWNEGARGHIYCDPPKRVSPNATHK